MLKGCYYIDNKVYLNNEIFNLDNDYLNRDNCLYGNLILKKEFLKLGVNLSTQDLNTPFESKFSIYNDFPLSINKFPKNSYLILWESEVIKPKNWDKKNHLYFKKIFTWNDDLVDNEKYFKINFTNELNLEYNNEIKNGFICLIAGNKLSKHGYELYSKRLEVINWYEKYNSFDFHFYGYGWENKMFNNKYINFFYRKSRLNKLIKNNFKNYRGSVFSKYKILNRYKFCICFENAQNINGYITEKIFDCFKSLTIPVYKGPPNILNYIPQDCFINFDDFKSISEMNNYLVNMTNSDIDKFHKSIKLFLNSENSKLFSNQYFIDTIINHTKEDFS